MSEGVTATVNNSGNVGSINTSVGSNTTVNNSGIIGTITTGEKSTNNINNNGFIYGINTGSDSRTTLLNNGIVIEINTGSSSVSTLYNFKSGYIGSVNNGMDTVTHINGIGYLGNYNCGWGDSKLAINGKFVPTKTGLYKTSGLPESFVDPIDYYHGSGYSYYITGEDWENFANASWSMGPIAGGVIKGTTEGLTEMQKLAVYLQRAAKFIVGADELGKASGITEGLVKTKAAKLVLNGTKDIGSLGEKIAKEMLEKNGWKDFKFIKNASDNGIDIIAKGPSGQIGFFEVKTSSTGKIGDLTKRQASRESFVKQILNNAANGEGRYKSVDNSTKNAARETISDLRKDPKNVTGAVIGVDLKTGSIYISRWGE